MQLTLASPGPVIGKAFAALAIALTYCLLHYETGFLSRQALGQAGYYVAVVVILVIAPGVVGLLGGKRPILSAAAMIVATLACVLIMSVGVWHDGI